MRRVKTSLLLAAGISFYILAGCKAKPQGKHYSIQAEVIAVELPQKLIIMRHGDIPGFMPAMAMSYSLAVPEEAKSLAPGDKISADLVVSNGIARVEKIVLVEKAKLNPAPASPVQNSP